MKRLLIVTGIFPPDIGGPATYVYNIMKELKNHFEVHVLTLGEEKDRDGIYYISRKVNFFHRSWKIKRFIERGDYEVIYSQSPFSVGFGIAIARTTAKKVQKVVGDNVWEISREILGVKDSIDDFQTKTYGPKITLMKKLQAFSVRNADLVITPSHYLKRLVGGWGVNEKRIKVIYNALEERNFKIDKKKKDVRKELGLKGFTYVCVARLAPWKGIDTLIEIFKEREENLIIIGDGILLEQFRSKSSGYENIKLLGRLPNDLTLRYIYGSDVLILNSGYEGLPHVVIEAFHLGTAVMISNVCGNPEIVRDDYNGFLFKYDDKRSIINAMNSINDEKIRIFRINSKKMLEKFSWRKMIDDTLEVLEK